MGSRGSSLGMLLVVIQGGVKGQHPRGGLRATPLKPHMVFYYFIKVPGVIFSLTDIKKPIL